MSSLALRQRLLALLTEACEAGSWLCRACSQIGPSVRTMLRWQNPVAGDDGDPVASTKRVGTPPPNRPSDTVRQAPLALLNSEEFKDLAASQIVRRMADQVHLVASESMLYRLLRDAAQLAHRLTEGAPQPRSRPRALEACRPANFYRRTIRYLPTGVRGSYFYPCLFVDVFSRKIVGWRAVRQRGC